jgi:redox-sensing transcriptional repressor
MMLDIDGKGSQAVKPIPEPTLRRLPIYYQYLKKAHKEGRTDFISATQIGNDLNILPIQVRKDLEVTDVIGKPKLGYSITDLMRTIEDFLGWNNTADAFLVGAGHLGAALHGYGGFREYGLNIIAAFDVDEAKIGTEIGGKMVFNLSKLPDMIGRMSIRIGVIATPAVNAQEVANIMVGAGIRAIWNFSPTKISVPPGIIVQHENLASSLVVLSKKLAMAMQATI